MAETIYKTFRAEIKEADADGTLNIFIPVSTASMDRDSEVIEPIAFKKTIPKFMKHPVLVASHDYRNLTNQIGEWTKLKVTEDGKGIEGKPKYYVGMGNEQADWAYKLAQKGVAAFSIGFIPKTWEDGDGEKAPRRTYKEVELLEISQVIIPSNRDAIMGMRSKSIDPIIQNLLDEIANAEIVDLTGEPDIELTEKPIEAGVHKKPTQEELKDEIDYIRIIISEVGINEDNKLKALDLAELIISRYPGDDMPVDIKEYLLSFLGLPLKEQEKQTLTAIQDVIKQKLADEVREAEDDKQEIEAIHQIVDRLFRDEVAETNKTQVDMLRKIVRHKISEV